MRKLDLLRKSTDDKSDIKPCGASHPRESSGEALGGEVQRKRALPSRGVVRMILVPLAGGHAMKGFAGEHELFGL